MNEGREGEYPNQYYCLSFLGSERFILLNADEFAHDEMNQKGTKVPILSELLCQANRASTNFLTRKGSTIARSFYKVCE